MKIKTFYILLSFLTANTITAQQIFIKQGKIEFEKKINLHKIMEDYSWMENFKDKVPQYKTTYCNLYFKDNKTLFEKGKETEGEQRIPFFADDKSEDDIIYTDLQYQSLVKKQTIFNDVFLLSDSIRKVEWRITNDTRDIAGFECRKAVGKILDSVYVIAFYTDQITVSGGPLSFCNLPGMILGIAIPRSNLTLFATKVELIEPKPEKMIAPTGKMKKIDYKGLQTVLQKAFSDWGTGRRLVISSLL
jgi:GLPGLI family protein